MPAAPGLPLLPLGSQEAAEAVEMWRSWGARVYPTVPNSKKGGLGKDWQLKEWPLSTWSEARPGEVPGLIIEGGFICVDTDTEAGRRHWEDVCREYVLECHRIEKTHRGYHYLFRLPPGVELPAIKYGRGVFRFEVLPRFTVAPCYRDEDGVKCRYEIVNDGEPGYLPAKLLAEFQRWSIERRPANEPPEEFKPAEPVRNPIGFIVDELKRIISIPAGQGRRQPESNNGVWRIGRVAHAFDETTKANIQEVCLRAVLMNGLEESRARELVPRAFEDGMAEPRALVSVPDAAEAMAAIQEATKPVRGSAANNGRPRVVPWPQFEEGSRGEIPYLIPMLLPEKALVVVAGKPKSGKTFHLGWMASEVARREKRALLVEEEGSAQMLAQRLRPFVTVNPEAIGVAFRNLTNLSTEAGYQALLGDVQAHRADVVLLDPLVFLMDGDENEVSTMRPVVQACIRLTTEAGCTVVLAHHVRKQQGKHGEGNGDITVDDLRGSSALRGAYDVCHLIQAREPSAKGMVTYELQCGESRYEGFATHRVDVLLEAVGNGIDMVVVEKEPTKKQVKQDLRIQELGKVIWDMLPFEANEQWNRNAIAGHVKRNGGDVTAALDWLKAKGWVANISGSRNAMYYHRLPKKAETRSSSEDRGLTED